LSQWNKCLASAILLSMVLIGLSCGQTDTTFDMRYIYHMDQNVDGNGFFSTYQSTDVTNLSLSNTAHGSGSLATDSKLNTRNGAKYDEKKDEYSKTSDRGIVLLEDMDYSYAPSSMQLGKYSLPITFHSRGSEQTALFNHISAVSMNAEFRDATTLSKNLSAELYWKLTSSSDIFESKIDSDSRTNLNFEAAFTGLGHVGVLDKVRKNGSEAVLIDEDYRGTYYITKNISHEYKYKLNQQADDWLPCCSNGFADMNSLDKKPFKSATGIFDCTCFDTPAKAEFPRKE